MNQTSCPLFVVPVLPAAGNSPDVVTRIVTERLTQMWKQQIVVLNRPGAGGLIAAQAAAGVPKDGYTLYMTQASTYTVLPKARHLTPLEVPDVIAAELDRLLARAAK